MRFSRTFTQLSAALAVLAAPAIAWSHPGHDGHEITWDFTGGAAHPLFGVDHVAAMVTVGIWAALLGGPNRWRLPASFLAAMALGGGAARLGVQFPLLEPLLGTSVVLLGFCLFLARQLPMAAAFALVSVFGAFHGLAHGAEIPPSCNPWTYSFGFLVGTAMLHGAGLAFGERLTKSSAGWRKLIALAVASTGAWILAS